MGLCERFGSVRVPWASGAGNVGLPRSGEPSWSSGKGSWARLLDDTLPEDMKGVDAVFKPSKALLLHVWIGVLLCA